MKFGKLKTKGGAEVGTFYLTLHGRNSYHRATYGAPHWCWQRLQRANLSVNGIGARIIRDLK